MREIAVPTLEPVTELAVSPDARVFEHGWQSFSPTTTYRIDERPHRPVSERNRILNYRRASHPGEDTFFGEGILAVDDGGGGVHLVVAEEPFTTGVRIWARRDGSKLVVSADGPVRVLTPRASAPGSAVDPLETALEDWALSAAEQFAILVPRRVPTAWCSWYEYYHGVTDADIDENLAAMRTHDLAVDVVQIDDGYEREIGDWLTPSERFTEVRGVVDRIRAEGRKAGIWIAPFFAGAGSQLAAEHPDWLLRHPHGGPLHAGHNWDQDLYSLDLTHPGAADWMRTVLETFAGWGIEYLKADFLAAGAIPGERHSGADPVTAYRDGLRLIREAVGPSVHLLDCGAPVLPSVGLVDSLRVSADTDAAAEPGDGDLSSPGQRGAILTARGRQFMNGVFFTNDPDCLIVSEKVEDREAWAAHVGEVQGAVVSSDRLEGLDAWGLETTRALLADAAAR